MTACGIDNQYHGPGHRSIDGPLQGGAVTGAEACEMSIQIIEGTCRDCEALRAQIDTWRRDLGPTARGGSAGRTA
jgi:hypothetical protein